MIPDTQSKFASYLEILNKMLPSEEENTFQLKRIRREAEQLKNSNPAEAFALLGMVSCLEEDIDAVHTNHKNALHYEDSLNQKTLYGISLFKLNLFDDAYTLFAEVFILGGGVDLMILYYLLHCAFYLDKEKEFDEYASLWVKLTSDNHPLIYNKEVGYMNFLEDDDRYLRYFLDGMDKYIDNNPNAVEEFDSELFALVDELVDGVEI